MGLEFGHRLGLPRALGALPLSPLVGCYQELVAQQRALGLRHIGEALVPSGGRLRVLDGVYVSRAPRGWNRVDGVALRQAAANNPAAGELLRRLADLHDRDPMALRRVLLYQLLDLLQSHPSGGRDALAASLGIDAGEATALAHAAKMRRPLDATQRTAAEALQDAWERGRLRRAARLASQLPTDGGRDPFLVQRLRQITARVQEADDVLATARRLEEDGDVEACASSGSRPTAGARCADSSVRTGPPRGRRGRSPRSCSPRAR